MSGIIQGPTNYLYNTISRSHQTDGSAILKELLHAVKECQSRYGSRAELATDSDSRVIRMCNIWDCVFAHGLKPTASVLRNVTDLVVAGATGNSSTAAMETLTFWEFAFVNLTSHEKERFNTLRHVSTAKGKGRSLIRAALNERSLERYILMWLNASNLSKCYEPWALLRDAEAANLLPSIAAGLGSVLFAVTVDTSDLNVMPLFRDQHSEPIIVAPRPSRSKSTPAHKRQLICFDDDEESSSVSSLSSATSAPKPLSSMCLKYTEADAIHDTNDKTQQISDSTTEPVRTSVTLEPEEPSQIQMLYQNDYRTSVTTTASSIDNDQTQDSAEFSANESDVFDVFTTDHSVEEDPIPNASSTSDTTSTQSSASSSLRKQSEDDIATLKDRLKYMMDRCAQLEDRIAELSLENHRLRGSARGRFTYFSVSVPRVLLQENGSKSHYVYEVHIIPTHGGDEWTILRRYNDFYKLHRKYQKDNIAVKTLDFPPKKSFGNMDAHFVEQRRQRLQVYLRHLLAALPEVEQCTTRRQLEVAFPFFT